MSNTAHDVQNEQLAECEAALTRARTCKADAVALLRDLARSGFPDVRMRAAQCLMEVGGDRAVIGLINLTSDSNPQVQRAAIGALGVLRAHQAKPVLREIIEKQADKETIIAAAAALGKLNDRSALLPIMTLLNDDSKRNRRLAVVALKDIINMAFSPTEEGIERAKRYLKVQAKKLLSGGKT